MKNKRGKNVNYSIFLYGCVLQCYSRRRWIRFHFGHSLFIHSIQSKIAIFSHLIINSAYRQFFPRPHGLFWIFFLSFSLFNKWPMAMAAMADIVSAAYHRWQQTRLNVHCWNFVFGCPETIRSESRGNVEREKKKQKTKNMGINAAKSTRQWQTIVDMEWTGARVCYPTF